MNMNQGNLTDVNRLMNDELMCAHAYIVLDLPEDTSAVSLVSLTKVKAAVGPHEY